MIEKEGEEQEEEEEAVEVDVEEGMAEAELVGFRRMTHLGVSGRDVRHR